MELLILAGKILGAVGCLFAMLLLIGFIASKSSDDSIWFTSATM